MFYRLNDKYELRGWKRLPFALRNRETLEIFFYQKPVFLTLMKCDGSEDIDLKSLSSQDQAIIEGFVKAGILEESQEFNPISASQRYRKYPSRFIASTQWSITGKCNYLCRHCFMSAPGNKFGELSKEDCFRIIDELARCGIQDVDLTGGEPLVRKDFFELIDYMLEKGIRVSSIYSNGRLVNEELLDGLEKRGLKPKISMSFDGVGWHDWIRGIPGAEKFVIDAYKLCQQRGFPTTAAMCLHKKNQDTIRDSVSLLKDLGVRSLKINKASPTGEWLKELEENKLTIEEAFDIYLKYIPEYFEDGAPISLAMEGFFDCEKGSKDYFSSFVKYPSDHDCSNKSICGHARNALYISPEGRALPCMPLAASNIEHKFPNILEEGLPKILDDSFYMDTVDVRLKDYLASNPECQVCEWKNNCGGGCRGLAVTEDLVGDDYMEIDRQTCIFYKQGYIHKVKEVADQAIQSLGK